MLNFFKKNISVKSKQYWELRYSKGGNSGSGSYNKLSEFKADVINNLMATNRLHSVIEFGVGDGNQLSLMKYEKFLGLDVSASAIKLCISRFGADKSKSFLLYDNECFNDAAGFLKADLVLSLDVIYHLIEQDVYEKYLEDLFTVASCMVVIYSTNEILPQFGGHEKHRVFTKDIERLISGWELKEEIKNKYPVQEYGEELGSRANFYIYIKK